MSRRHFLVVLALAGTLALPAAARPLPVDDLGDLAANVDADVLLRLAERRGLDRPLGPEDRLALGEAGVAPEVVERLVTLSAPPVELDGVSYATVDGVLRVRGEGEEAEAFEAGATEPSHDSFESFEQDSRGEWHEGETHAPPAESLAEEAPMGWGNPFPAGAFGTNVGAVFVPARFGDRPSAFGTTFVSTAPVVAGPYFGLAPAPVAFNVAPFAPRAADHPPGFIPFRTSRGTLWVPN